MPEFKEEAAGRERRKLEEIAPYIDAAMKRKNRRRRRGVRAGPIFPGRARREYIKRPAKSP
jgi:hypothetical protein